MFYIFVNIYKYYYIIDPMYQLHHFLSASSSCPKQVYIYMCISFANRYRIQNALEKRFMLGCNFQI